MSSWNGGAAVALARNSDVAILFAADNYGDVADRVSLALPGHLDRLISAVAAVNSRTIVVLNTSGPVAMPRVNKVGAILELWCPDDAFGAIDEAHFDEGLLIGYRWYDVKLRGPLFPFGHGLDYSRIDIKDVKLDARDAVIKATFHNPGVGADSEVVQAYLALPAALAEPPRRLAAFGIWGEAADRWTTPGGKYTVFRSSHMLAAMTSTSTQLKGDAEAAKLFIGPAYGLCKDPARQVE